MKRTVFVVTLLCMFSFRCAEYELAKNTAPNPTLLQAVPRCVKQLGGGAQALSACVDLAKSENGRSKHNATETSKAIQAPRYSLPYYFDGYVVAGEYYGRNYIVVTTSEADIEENKRSDTGLVINNPPD